MDKFEKYGVITGDLINSTILKQDQKDTMMVQLNEFFESTSGIVLPMQFYRGDSFQLLCTKEKAARIAIFVESIIIATTSTFARISIGIGSVSGLVENNVLQSSGEAFVLSGHQLDSMKKEDRLMKIAIESPQFQPILAASFYLAESIIWSWKPGQASVISMIPTCKTQKEIAEKLQISGAAVSKALKWSRWAAMEDFLNGYEETIKEI
jgi:hypothetical protein